MDVYNKDWSQKALYGEVVGGSWLKSKSNSDLISKYSNSIPIKTLCQKPSL